MDGCYILEIDNSVKMQGDNDYSFIGGYPRVPSTELLPKCKLCGKELTFYFQIAFPIEHYWSNLTMAIFSCTMCSDRNFLIPEMLKVPLKGANIPNGFLDEYQKNFKILIFDTSTGIIRQDYKPKIKYKCLNLKKTLRSSFKKHKVGGKPSWYLEDESPLSYNETIPMFFLMQLLEEYRFELLDDAPGQVKIDYFNNGIPMSSNNRYYELFLRNNIYFFATKDGQNPLVYIITQI